MAEVNPQNTQGQKKGGCGVFVLIVIVAIVIGGIVSGNSGSSGSRSSGIAASQNGQSAGIADGARFIEYNGGVDTETASRSEYLSGVQRMKDELAQVFDDMEGSFFADTFTLLWTSADLPASVFWVDSWAWSSTKDQSSDAYVYRFDIEYSCTKEERDRMQTEVDKAADAILSQIPDGADAWTKAYVIHNALSKTVSYDHSLSKEHIFDIYGALVKHEAVCAGYAKAFEYLMGKVGETATYDSSTFHADDPESSHAWNYAWVNGEYYCIDVTWDDTDYVDRFGRPYINYDYFGLTATELARVDSHESINTGTGGSSGSAYSKYSFHAKIGAMLESYDRTKLISTFKEQYSDGSNLLTVKFGNERAFETAMKALCGSGWRDLSTSDGSGLSTLLFGSVMPDYTESYYYSIDADLYILNVYLYPPTG